MAVSAAKFIEQLSVAGVLAAEELSGLRDQLSPEQLQADAEQLAKELVKSGKLTKFQAAAIYQGRAKGLVFGEYVVLDKLGAGGMGQVYKARHRRMKRMAAVKVLSPHIVKDAQAVRRFYQEVEMAAKLAHPNIVASYDAAEANGQHFLVMEFVDGRDLSSILQKQGPLQLQQVINCIRQAAEGLAFAHAQGVVHRDIKPGNLLIDKSGAVKILDMGLARTVDALEQQDKSSNQELTQAGQVMGTVDYMAPEQARDARTADHRADIYSLGCTLYRLLTGYVPYPADTMVKKLMAHVQQPIPSLKKHCPEVPPQLEALFHRMLEKDPTKRISSAKEVADLLKGLLTGVDQESSSVSVLDDPAESDEWQSFVKTSASAVTSTGKSSTSPAVAASVSAIGSSVGNAGMTKSAAAAPRKRPQAVLYVSAVAASLLLAVGGRLALRSDAETQPLEARKPEQKEPERKETTGKQTGAVEQQAEKKLKQPEPELKPIQPPPAEPTGESKLTITNSQGIITTTKSMVEVKPPVEDAAVITKTTATVTIPGEQKTPPPESVKPAEPTTPPEPAKPADLPPPSEPTGTTVAATPPVDSTDDRAPVPDEIKLKTARDEVVKNIYRSEFAAAKKPEEKAALAKQLYESALPDSEPVGRYALLMEAGELAAEGHDAAQVEAAAELAAKTFQVTKTAWAADRWDPASKQIYTAVAARAVAPHLLKLVDEAVLEEQYDVAKKLMTAGLAYANKSSDKTTTKAATDRNTQLIAERTLWDALNQARATLKDHPDDADANLKLGKHLCFAVGDWDAGLPLLAKGKDPVLKDLAGKSIPAPTETAAQMDLGNQWYAKWETASINKRELLIGALHWYLPIQEKVAGLDKTKIDKRLAEHAGVVATLKAGGMKAVAGVAPAGALPVAGAGFKNLQNKFSVKLAPSLDLTLQLIQPGEFIMGGTVHPKESPAHHVRITKPFYLGIHEVTQAQWQQVMNTDPWKKSPTGKNGPDVAANYISRDDAAKFCVQLTTFAQQSNLIPATARFRLPTEAEWEYACRAESTSEYSCGDDTIQLNQFAWIDRNARFVGEDYPHRVGQKLPNKWGLYDMHGNVAEWCSDWYADYPSGALQVDPTGPASGDHAVLRGGFWQNIAASTRSAYRGFYKEPDYAFAPGGFRVACEVVPSTPGR